MEFAALNSEKSGTHEGEAFLLFCQSPIELLTLRRHLLWLTFGVGCKRL